MISPHGRIRRGLSVIILVAVVVAGIAWLGPRDTAQAADLSRFQAGDIISDAFFYDGWAMSAGDVQAFLDQKGASCRTGADGTSCLKVFRQDTASRAGDDRCAGYQGGLQESAAVIITKVAQACGISPRVLLVMLQKEQALVTNSGASLNATRYRSAMGFGCPDTAPCDTLYYGFYNQVYSAARQFKNYAATPQNYAATPQKYGYRAGLVNQVRFSPNAACGSPQVYILNQATAGLYNYTPYQPNTAALNAGYGSGDGCSAYGNRNFYSYFTDWFGSTHELGATQISLAYYRVGPSSLGGPLGDVGCGLAGGGCVQRFERASIYWSPGSGAHVLGGAIFTAWARAGWEVGALGYPISDELVAADGVGRLQQFQGGSVFWSPTTNAQVVRGVMFAAWAAVGADTGPYGYPISGELVAADGVGRLQQFEGGSIFWSPATGARPVRAAIFTTWAGMGADTGVLGYPTSGELVAADGVGRLQQFQGGSIFWSPTTGAQPVRGAMFAAWARLGADAGALGYPTGVEVPGAAADSVVQQFQGGAAHWSPATGGHAVLRALADGWAQRGGAVGLLGLPVGDQRRLTGGAVAQDFQNGVLYGLSATQSVTVRGAVLTSYRKYDADAGPLGLPLTEEQTVGSTQVQQFQSGSVYWTAASGAHPVRGAIAAAWSAAGGLGGALGVPTSDEFDAGAGRGQSFTGGTVYWSGGSGGHVVRGAIWAAYQAAGGPAGPLGLPLTEEQTVGSTQVQQFQSGSVYRTAASGAHPVRGAIAAAWSAAGGLGGALGVPTSDEFDAGAGRGQSFTGGTVYWSGGSGGHVVRGAVAAAYLAAGGPAGPLGLPLTEEQTVGSTQVQQFQSGSVYRTAASGAHPVRGAVGATWSATGGLQGPLGVPTGDETPLGSGVVQQFRGGALYWAPAAGTRRMGADVLAAWIKAGGPTGTLGEPLADQYVQDQAQRVDFQHGRITIRPGQPAEVVTG
ncbi:Uncharacterized conserved protein, contains LGFP repeats [Modestobacter sp. DSM 44400]|nr:Uncharacterized conserved protein, contains LGFP repeats [Modestobacter sp. DSM 44400]